MVGRRDLLRRGGAAIVATGIGGNLTGSAAAEDQPGQGPPKHVMLIILDRSGSMSGMQAAVTESINALLDEHADKDNMFIGLVQFDSMKTAEDLFCEPIFGFCAANATPRLGPHDYMPRGNTPLLAAVAEGIGKLEQVIRPQDRALMVFQTDGHENSSPREITKEVIRSLIKAKEAAGNWTFAFLGADIDAWGEGGSLGVHQGSTMAYANTARATRGAYAATADSVGAWYSSTGGSGLRGMSVEAAVAAPSNTNANFFTPVAEPTPPIQTVAEVKRSRTKPRAEPPTDATT